MRPLLMETLLSCWKTLQQADGGFKGAYYRTGRCSSSRKGAEDLGGRMLRVGAASPMGDGKLRGCWKHLSGSRDGPLAHLHLSEASSLDYALL